MGMTLLKIILTGANSELELFKQIVFHILMMAINVYYKTNYVEALYTGLWHI